MSVTLNVTKEFDCDVLVVGAGCAGFSAAVAASRGGAKTMLCDMNGCIGGMATAGLVGPFMTSYDTDGKKQIIVGFFDEFVRRMEKENGAIHPSKAEWGTAYTSFRTTGHKNLTAFDAEVYKRVAEDICREENVRLLYHAMLIKTDVTEGDIKCAYFATKSGIYKINAKVFIDATGDADLAAMSGVGTVYGDGAGEVQPASTFFTVRGVDKEKMTAHMEKHRGDMRKMFYMDEIERARETGEFPCYRAKIMLFEGLGGQWIVNMSQMDDVNACDAEQVTAAEIEGRTQVPKIISFLKKYAAGCENIELIKSASVLGVRESRRIEAEYVVAADDCANSVHFDDRIMLCSNSMDIHKKGGVDYVARNTNEPYEIPYRSLVAKGVNNLLAAGRCAGGERPVMAAIRVMPPCFAMGQAAGSAAAIAAHDNKNAKDIDIAKLQDTLIKNGAYLG